MKCLSLYHQCIVLLLLGHQVLAKGQRRVLGGGSSKGSRTSSKSKGSSSSASKQSTSSGSSSSDASTQQAVHVIFSTDCSGGLFGPNAAYDECPALVNSSLAISHGPVAYRDIDDLMAITLALNSDNVMIDCIVPIFGDASMAANVLTGRQLVHEIKGEREVPVVPGAVSASQPVFIDSWRIIATVDEVGWGGPLPVADVQKPNSDEASNGNSIDPVTLFRLSCVNAGVMAMQDSLAAAAENDYKVSILGIGPMTDIACLLLQADGDEDQLLFESIDKLVLLIGQEAGVAIGSGGATARDFNMVTDPMAAAVVLSFSDTVPIVLMEIELTIQTTFDPDLAILFNNDTFRPDTLPFFVQAKEKARRGEGPFDQYTIAYTLHPEWFNCTTDTVPAYVIQCGGDDDDDEDDDKNGDDDSASGSGTPQCTSATAYSSGYTSGVSAELTIDLFDTYDGPLVVGNSAGNILNYQSTTNAARVTACTDFADENGYDSFRDFVYNLQ